MNFILGAVEKTSDFMANQCQKAEAYFGKIADEEEKKLEEKKAQREAAKGNLPNGRETAVETSKPKAETTAGRVDGVSASPIGKGSPSAPKTWSTAAPTATKLELNDESSTSFAASRARFEQSSNPTTSKPTPPPKPSVVSSGLPKPIPTSTSTPATPRTTPTPSPSKPVQEPSSPAVIRPTAAQQSGPTGWKPKPLPTPPSPAKTTSTVAPVSAPASSPLPPAVQDKLDKVKKGDVVYTDGGQVHVGPGCSEETKRQAREGNLVVSEGGSSKKVRATVDTPEQYRRYVEKVYGSRGIQYEGSTSDAQKAPMASPAPAPAVKPASTTAPKSSIPTPVTKKPADTKLGSSLAKSSASQSIASGGHVLNIDCSDIDEAIRQNCFVLELAKQEKMCKTSSDGTIIVGEGSKNDPDAKAFLRGEGTLVLPDGRKEYHKKGRIGEPIEFNCCFQDCAVTIFDLYMKKGDDQNAWKTLYTFLDRLLATKDVIRMAEFLSKDYFAPNELEQPNSPIFAYPKIKQIVALLEEQFARDQYQERVARALYVIYDYEQNIDAVVRIVNACVEEGFKRKDKIIVATWLDIAACFDLRYVANFDSFSQAAGKWESAAELCPNNVVYSARRDWANQVLSKLSPK